MNDESKKIQTILENNSETIAFLIGNGIHYQYKDCDLPWDKLLENLWYEYTHTKQTIPNGTSFTEFYDILEMIALAPKGKTISDRAKTIADKIRNSGVNLSMDEIKLESILKKFPSIFDTKIIDKTQLSSFREQNQLLIDNSREFCKDNYDDTKTLSDEECVYIATSIITDDKKGQLLRNSIKKEVANKFPEKQAYNLSILIENLKKYNCPILTTNFDTYIEKSIGARKYILQSQGNQYKFTDYYPWNVYYSAEEINSPSDGFAIWHINGLTDYYRSIRLGLCDYMGCVERARKMIHKGGLNEFFEGKNQYNWAGSNTWLHVLFSKDLFIFGLTLDENETFLRWLLIQRAKYSQLYSKKLKGWYIVKDKDVKNGKRFFLEHLGFEIIEISDYNDMYQSFNRIN